MLTVWLIRVATLSDVLTEGSISLPKLDLTFEQIESFASIIAGFQSVLNKLRETPEKYQKLDIDHKSYNLKDLHVKIHKAWGELTWNQENLAEAQNRISSYIQSFNDFYGRLNMYLSLISLIHGIAKTCTEQGR